MSHSKKESLAAPLTEATPSATMSASDNTGENILKIVYPPTPVTAVKITRSFRAMSTGPLLVFCDKVVTAMENNPYFAKPEPTIADVKIEIEALRSAFGNSSTFGGYYVGIMDTARATLLVSMDTLANWVVNNCNDDALIAGFSGFTIGKTNKSAAPIPNVVTGTDVRYNKTQQETYIRCDAQAELKGFRVTYTVYASMDKGVTWQQFVNGGDSRRLVLPSLKSGEIYTFCVTAKTTTGEGPKSAEMVWLAK